MHVTCVVTVISLSMDTLPLGWGGVSLLFCFCFCFLLGLVGFTLGFSEEQYHKVETGALSV